MKRRAKKCKLFKIEAGKGSEVALTVLGLSMSIGK